MILKTLNNDQIHHQNVLIRCDLNVNLQQGEIFDDTRLQTAAKTLDGLLNAGARPIIMAHLGRPNGKPDPELSLAPIAHWLEQRLQAKVLFCSDPFSDATLQIAQSLEDGEAILLENLRFWPEEQQNDTTFAAALARLANLYINDGFPVSHRAHASTAAIADHLPAFAGPTLAEEVAVLERILHNPQKPTIGIIGGAKISTKISIIANLIAKFDHLIIGGAMANSFLHAQGYNVGTSLVEPDTHDLVADIRARAGQHHCRLILPVDLCVANGLDSGDAHEDVALDQCPPDKMILDIGTKTINAQCALLDTAKTVLWNGPLGAFEHPPFDQGTRLVARHVAKRCQAGHCLAVAGGGDTLAAMRQAETLDQFSYVSTAGGAFLEWLEGKVLPGIAPLIEH